MYDRTRDEGFGAEVKRRIMLGTYVLSAGYYDAYYLKAQQVRTLLRQDYDRRSRAVDVVAMPTTPTPAFQARREDGDPLQMYLADVFTVSANLAGLPAISIPCGFSPDRLPIGLQLTGRMFDEATLLRAADAYQRDTRWHTAKHQTSERELTQNRTRSRYSELDVRRRRPLPEDRPEQQAEQDERNRRNHQADDRGDQRRRSGRRRARETAAAARRDPAPCRRRRRPGRPAATAA